VDTWISQRKSKLLQLLWNIYDAILLCNRHPHRLNKSRATISKRLHPESISTRCSSCWR
jgi:hypothetical protein